MLREPLHPQRIASLGDLTIPNVPPSSRARRFSGFPLRTPGLPYIEGVTDAGLSQKGDYNPIDGLQRAMRANDVKGMQSSLNTLNQMLTGRDLGDFRQDVGSRVALSTKLEIFVEEHEVFQKAETVVFLGDFGHSHIVIRKKNGEISAFLSEASTDEIKRKWNKLLEQQEKK